jgi:hypothetical protein
MRDQRTQYLVNCKERLERLLQTISLDLRNDLTSQQTNILERRLRFACSIAEHLAKLDLDNETNHRPLLARAAYYGAIFADRANRDGVLVPGQLELAESAVRNDPSNAEYCQLLARLRHRRRPPSLVPRAWQEARRLDVKARLIGYLAKRTAKRQSYLPDAVEEVCSVSCCISKAPSAGQQPTRMGFCSSETLALRMICAEPHRGAYDVYAYFMLPVAFEDDGEMRDLNQTERDVLAEAENGVGQMPQGYVCLGWDFATNSLGWETWPLFGCSPLTCNGLAQYIATNRYGLIDDIDRAFAVAGEIVQTPCEPGPYYLVQVWRKERLRVV